MRKITPMILVTLMLVSALSSFDFAELEETEVIEDAGARAGADAEMIAITNPKETICPFEATCRNVLKVGDVTEFTSYIKNSGDTDIANMGYTVEVWISDANANPSQLAKNLNGDDLAWTNNDVICDLQGGCPYQSLAAGAVLGGGKHTMSMLGTPIQWTPTEGFYVIKMIVNSVSDSSPVNDDKQIFVSVEDWYDIQVDLAWDSGNEIESGTGSKAWTLTVTANASDTFDPREVNVRIQTVGDALAVDSDQVNIDSSTTNIYTAGTSTTVDVYQDESTEPPSVTSGLRSVLSTWTLEGVLNVDAGTADSASYGMKASLVNYTQYGQWTSCAVSSGSANNTTTSDNYCEEIYTTDAYPSTDATSIDGSATIFNDIRISDMSLFQGFNSDGTGEPTTIVSSVLDGDLNVGTSYLWVEAEHRGSSLDSTYDWSVDFSVIDATGVETSSLNVTTCTAIEPLQFEYIQLGFSDTAEPIVRACVMVNLTMDGEYTFSASLVNDSKMDDAKPSNNRRSLTLNVRNNDPIITSLEVITDAELNVQQAQPVVMIVSVFDVDDPSASGLTIEWTHNGVALPGCERGTVEMTQTCTMRMSPETLLSYPISVTVYDAHGGQANQEEILEIWNKGTYGATTTSGLSLEYTLTYWDTTPFNLTATDGVQITNQQLPQYSGLYDSVGVIEYVPITTYDGESVLSQSLTVTLDKSVGATSLWYVVSGSWALLSDATTDIDATTEMFSYTIPSDFGVFTQGAFVLMGGSLAQAEAPSASITGFNAAAAKAGAIQINWGVEGTMLIGDTLVVTICETVVGEDCTSAFEVSLGAGNTSYTYAGQNTVHGVNYTVSVAVCNEVGCSTPVGAGYVVSDKKVDGGAMATNLTITNGTTWTVSWNATGDQSDVASWNVCHKRGTFTAAQIDDTTCVNVVGTTVELDTTKWKAGTYTAYVSAMPVDALGNSESAGAMNSADFQRDADTTNSEDGVVVVGEEVKSGVPTWTWGVIGGVVVIAFIAGAFILSRGGAGDEGKDWDY